MYFKYFYCVVGVALWWAFNWLIMGSKQVFPLTFYQLFQRPFLTLKHYCCEVWKHYHLALHECQCVLCSVCTAGLGKEIWLARGCHQWPGAPCDRCGANQGQTTCQLGTEDGSAAGTGSSRLRENPKETRTQARQQGSSLLEDRRQHLMIHCRLWLDEKLSSHVMPCYMYIQGISGFFKCTDGDNLCVYL